MKKGFLFLGILLTGFFLLPTQQLAAQYDNSPWNAPRWSSVQVTYAVNGWFEEQGLLPDEDGEWLRVRYTDFSRGVWTVVITWYIDGQEGEVVMLVSSNGSYTLVDPAALTEAELAALLAGDA